MHCEPAWPIPRRNHLWRGAILEPDAAPRGPGCSSGATAFITLAIGGRVGLRLRLRLRPRRPPRSDGRPPVPLRAAPPQGGEGRVLQPAHRMQPAPEPAVLGPALSVGFPPRELAPFGGAFRRFRLLPFWTNPAHGHFNCGCAHDGRCMTERLCVTAAAAFVIRNFLRAARQVRDTCRQMPGATRLLTRQVRADRVGSCDV